LKPGVEFLFFLESSLSVIFIHTLIHLENLGISRLHPCVLVELALFLLFIIIGVYLRTKKEK
jgi:hypothetical protein